MTLSSVGVGLVLVGLVSVSEVQAASITFEFLGTVETVTNTTGSLNSSISAGSPFTASFVFNTNSPDTSLGDPIFGSYGGISATANIENFSFKAATQDSDLVEVLVGNSSEFNGYLYSAFDAQSEVSFDLGLFDSAGTAITTKTLLTRSPNLDAYTDKFFTIASSEPSNDIFDITGTITSVSVSGGNPEPVPEPSSALGLLGMAVIVAGLKMKRNLKK